MRDASQEVTMADSLPEPEIVVSTVESPVSFRGKNTVIHTWSGSGPDYTHVHRNDDEAWHVLQGLLSFRAGGRTFEAGPGTTVVIPAGVAHTYWEEKGPTLYLMILTPRLDQLIAELHQTPYQDHGKVLEKFDSFIVRDGGLAISRSKG